MWSVWLVFSDCGFHSVCSLMVKDRRLMEASWWKRLRGKLGLTLMGGAMLSKSLIQFSVDGRSHVPSLLFDLRPNYGGGNENNGNLLHALLMMHCYMHCPMHALLHSVPPTLQQATANPHLCWRILDIHGKSGSVSCGVTASFSWVLVCTSFSLCPPRVCFPSPV